MGRVQEAQGVTVGFVPAMDEEDVATSESAGSGSGRDRGQLDVILEQAVVEKEAKAADAAGWLASSISRLHGRL